MSSEYWQVCRGQRRGDRLHVIRSTHDEVLTARALCGYRPRAGYYDNGARWSVGLTMRGFHSATRCVACWTAYEAATSLLGVEEAAG